MAVSSLTEPSFASRQQEVMLLNLCQGHLKSYPSFPEPRSPRAVRTAEKIARFVGVEPNAASRCCTKAEAEQTPLPRAGKPRYRKMNQLTQCHTHTSVRGRGKWQLSPVLLRHCAENDHGAVTQVQLTVTVTSLCTQSLLSYRNMPCPLLSLVSYQSHRFTC